MGETIFYAFLIILAILFISAIVKSFTKEGDREKSRNTFDGSYRTRNGSQDTDTLPPIVTNVAGVTFEGRQSVVESLHIGETLVLVQEPDNPYDKKAIRVERRNGVQVGYIPKELAKDMDWHFYALGTPRPAAEVIKKTGSRWKSQNFGVVKAFNNHLEPNLCIEMIGCIVVDQ